jgi:Mg/Co/Ni transporter MgtE
MPGHSLARRTAAVGAILGAAYGVSALLQDPVYWGGGFHRTMAVSQIVVSVIVGALTGGLFGRFLRRKPASGGLGERSQDISQKSRHTQWVN